MDSERFDDFARTMVSTSSRRVALPAVVGALVGLPGIAAQGSDRSGGADDSVRAADHEVVRKEARRFEQSDPDGDGGPQATGKKTKKKKAKKQPIGLRAIWW